MPDVLKTASKLNAIFLFAGVATFSLFYVMQLLIMQEQGIPEPGTPRFIPNITLPVWKPDVNRITPKPQVPDDPPDLPDNPFINPLDAAPSGIQLTQLPQNTPVDVEGIYSLGPADGNAMPIAQIQPVYPSRALARGLEGFVIVEFDVSENGTVINPRVLGSQPSGIFDQAALRAIERWKYNPKVVNGRVMKMTGLQTRFSFSLRE